MGYLNQSFPGVKKGSVEGEGRRGKRGVRKGRGPEGERGGKNEERGQAERGLKAHSIRAARVQNEFAPEKF